MDANRAKTIMTLALPIIGGMVSQNILNLIDTAMVSHLGDNALAAVGIGGFATFMATAFITGLSSGVQAMAARRLGEGQTDKTAIPLNGGVLLAIAMALPLTGLLFFATPSLFPYLMSEPAVIAVGVPYVQVRMLGIAATGVNFVFRGYWNGVNLSKLYMRTLVLMHITNIILNYVLIFGKFGAPELGATGAAIGTTASLYVGSAYYIIMGFVHAREGGFFSGLPDKQTILTMLRLSIPMSLQNFFFAAGMTTFFWIVGKLGTAELAASQVLVNLLLVALLPGVGFGLAAASLVGQALGRRDKSDAKQWGWDVMQLATVVVALLALPSFIFPDFFLGWFLHNPETLEIARLPMRMIAAGIALDVAGLVLMNALLGAGDARRVMVVSILMQWAVNLPLAYLLGVHLGYGLIAVWLVQLTYRAIQSGIFILLWKQGTWADIEV
jgi:putative MATE family efflux protein